MHHDVFLFEPKVYLVGYSQLHQPHLDEFFLDEKALPPRSGDTDCDVIPEIAGRLCYMSFDKPRPGGNSAYLKHIKEVGHGSVLEHTVFNFIFTQISRSLSHELVRHRAGMAYSQLSQRYVESNGVRFVVPHELRKEMEHALLYLIHNRDQITPGSAKLGELGLVAQVLVLLGKIYNHYDPHPGIETVCGLEWMAFVLGAREEYSKRSSYLWDRMVPSLPDKHSREEQTSLRKATRSTARSVLPNATETKIFVTANARAVRHFLEMRGSSAAEVEMRKLAQMVLGRVRRVAPNLFWDYDHRPLPDGTVEITTPMRKV